MALLVASRLPLEKDSSCVLQELKKVRRHLFDTFGVGLTGSLGIQASQRSLNILRDNPLQNTLPNTYTRHTV